MRRVSCGILLLLILAGLLLSACPGPRHHGYGSGPPHQPPRRSMY